MQNSRTRSWYTALTCVPKIADLGNEGFCITLWVSHRGVLGRPRGRFGIRLGDVGMTAVVLVAVELSVVTGSGPGAARLDAVAYLFGVLVLPVLLRHAITVAGPR